MKHLFFSLAFITLSLCISAQGFTPGMVDFARPDQMSKNTTTEVNGEQVKGTPFLTDQWLTGTVKLKNGSTYDNYNLLYNTFTQSLLFEQDGKAMQVSDQVQEFTLLEKGKKARVFINASSYLKTEKNAFYEVLVSSATGQLLKLNRMVIDQPFEKVTSMKNFEPEAYYFYYDTQKDKLSKLKRGGNNAVAAALKLTPYQVQDLGLASYNLFSDEGLKDFFSHYLAIN